VAFPTNQLEAEIRQLFEDEGVILLDFNTSGRSGSLMLRAVADRRSGSVSIDDCVRLTRQIQHLISEKKLLAEEYRLEVSSPGLEYPLTQEWQFTKNVGRLLKAQVTGEKGPREISGRLMTADHDGITVVADKSEWKLGYRDVLSAQILPEFKPPRMESN
jgi:ribosome maturation factor RimP